MTKSEKKTDSKRKKKIIFVLGKNKETTRPSPVIDIFSQLSQVFN